MNPLLQHYGVILADPPWTFATYSRKGKGRSAEAHYDCMSLADIKALPVADWATPNCALFLWTTDPSLQQALEVIAAWGFTYKTVAFTWAKTTKDGTRFPIGCGYWTRANPEQCFLATRGRPQRLSRAVPQLVLRGRTGPPTVGDDKLLVMLIRRMRDADQKKLSLEAKDARMAKRERKARSWGSRSVGGGNGQYNPQKPSPLGTGVTPDFGARAAPHSRCHNGLSAQAHQTV